MHLIGIARSLVLLTLANGAPVVGKKVFGARFAYPLDCGVTFLDRRLLLGPSKTIRGIALSLVVTTAGAPLVGIPPQTGALMAVAAMAGDLFSSFVKRRLHRPSSSRALGLDQVPESLAPLLVCQGPLGLSAADIALAVAVFFIGELVLSRLLYKAHLRDQPY
jgi:CDP-archaeol synthase